MKLFAGLEGGASSSKLVILSDEGHVVYQDDFGPPTNHWLIGLEELIQRVIKMIEKSGQQLASLSSLTLCLSGCEDQNSNQLIRKEFQNKTQIKTVFVESDTLAPLWALNEKRGVVLISGTGSNCLLVDQEKSVNCGGWGHVLGDEGSAFWISRKAIKAVINRRDNYKSGFESKLIEEMVLEFFQFKDFKQILDKIYSNFEKSEIASLCLQISKMAEKGDPLSKHIFYCAGVHLGRHVKAVLTDYSHPKAVVVCVGSVFNSWSLLSSEIKTEIILKRLKSSSAIGAALIGAHNSGHTLKVDTESELLAHFKDGQLI